jgi:hypothetical protein
MLLIQFNYPERNKPIVEFYNKMTPSWLNNKIRWTQKEYFKVVKACEIIQNIKP